MVMVMAMVPELQAMGSTAMMSTVSMSWIGRPVSALSPLVGERRRPRAGGTSQ
jgi:hypothetical protein